MLKLMLITNDPGLASFAVKNGVQRVFVDLEIHGKQERQGHRDTLISKHTMADVGAVRAAIPGHELLVRINPVFDNSEDEVEKVVQAGADIIMLPMFTNMEEIRRIVKSIAGRCRFVPLVETVQATRLAGELVREAGVDELYIGLNDLHQELGMDFMFELLVEGTVERIAKVCCDACIPFGFGGIARMEEGMLSGEMVLSEHLRLGSSAVILSRTFHRNSGSVEELQQSVDLSSELRRLREAEVAMAQRSAEQVGRDHQLLLEKIGEICTMIADKRTASP